MNITEMLPDGEINLYNVPWNSSYDDVRLYGSEEIRRNEMPSFLLQGGHIPGQPTIQKDGSIIIDGVPEEMYKCNYVMFRNNTALGNPKPQKEVYSFVRDIKWRSENSVELILETDVFQTWIFDMWFKKSFHIRDTPEYDNIGDYTMAEGLELGEYLVRQEFTAGLNEMICIVASTVNMSNNPTDSGVWQGIYGGAALYVFDLTISAQKNQLGAWLTSLTNAGKSDAIVAMYMAPKALIGSAPGGSGGYLGESSVASRVSKSAPGRPTTLDLYTPKCNKLYTYPYMYLHVHNNQGSAAAFRYENFLNPLSPRFSVFSTIQGGVQVKATPIDYGLRSGRAEEESLVMSGYPMCSWNIDTYAAWFAAHGQSAQIAHTGGMIAAGAGLLTSIFTGGATLGGTVSTLTGVMSSMAAWEEAKLQPPQARGSVGSGSANAAGGVMDFYFQAKTLKKDAAKRIDDFFWMYGYKVNELKDVELHKRTYWDYIQLAECNFFAPMPAKDMEKFKSIFLKGVRIWHTSAVGNYTLDNRGKIYG